VTQVSFYSLSNDDETGHALSCSLAASLFTDKQRTSIWCKNQQQAESIDELLWQLPAERFVPHNLVGEGPNGGAPVEVCWQIDQLRRNASVIVLSGEQIAQPNNFKHIIDFVPAEDSAKAAARERYKYYQRAGCTMRFTQADS
jgi:DNA polymerase-3 subunit chi